MRDIEKRLTRLEAQSSGGTILVFRKSGETAEQAKARQYPEGLPPRSHCIVVSWLEAA